MIEFVFFHKPFQIAVSRPSTYRPRPSTYRPRPSTYRPRRRTRPRPRQFTPQHPSRTSAFRGRARGRFQLCACELQFIYSLLNTNVLIISSDCRHFSYRPRPSCVLSSSSSSSSSSSAVYRVPLSRGSTFRGRSRVCTAMYRSLSCQWRIGHYYCITAAAVAQPPPPFHFYCRWFPS